MTAMDGLRVPMTIGLGVLAILAGTSMFAAEVATVPYRSAPHLAFFAALALGGAVLLGTLWRPARLTARLVAVAGAVGVVGAAAGLTVERVGVCCMFAYHQTRGFPFAWLGRGFSSDDNLTDAQAIARMDATGIDWQLQSGTGLIANLVFWACAALIVVVPIAVATRRARGAYAGQRDREPDPEPVDIGPVDA